MSPFSRVPRTVSASCKPTGVVNVGAWPGDDRTSSPAIRLLRAVRVVRRGLAILAWTGVACAIQSVLLLLPGRAKARFARVYWSVTCVLLGMRIRVIRPSAPSETSARPIIYVSNHSSWIDVPVLGARVLGCFVAKEDVSRWPVVGTVARLGRTIFVSRQRKATGRERDDMRLRLAGGDNLILFPEGTSSDGTRVLPFLSSFFAAAKPSNGVNGLPDTAPGCRPLVQPVSVVYDRLAGLPVGNARRAVFAWYGDMDLASHFWQLAQWRTMRASIVLHPALDPADFPTRKALAQATWEAVSMGAGELRQNRPVTGAMRVPEIPQRLAGSALETSLDNPAPSFA